MSIIGMLGAILAGVAVAWLRIEKPWLRNTVSFVAGAAVYSTLAAAGAP